jgi:hypothetical protein
MIIHTFRLLTFAEASMKIQGKKKPKNQKKKNGVFMFQNFFFFFFLFFFSTVKVKRLRRG